MFSEIKAKTKKYKTGLKCKSLYCGIIFICGDQFLWIVGFLLFSRDVISWMRRFQFQEETTKNEPSRILMNPKY